MKLDRDGKALLSLYVLALLPKLGLFFLKGIQGDAPIFLYARREVPFWDPLPVYFFQILSRLTAHNLFLLGLCYAILSAATAPVVRQLALTLGLSPRAAFWSAVWVSFYPYYVSAAWYQPEVGITILLTALCALAFAGLGQDPSLRRGFGAVLSGVLLLFDRPDGLIFVFFLGAMAFAASGARRQRALMALSLAVALGLGAIAVVNYHALGRFSPLPAKSGYNLLLGHNAAVNGYLKASHASTMELAVLDAAFGPFPEEVLKDKQNPIFSDRYRREAFRFIREHPGLTLVNTGYKLLRYWDWRLEDADRESPVKNAIYAISYLSVLILAAAGTISLVHARRLYPVLFAWGGMVAFSIPGLVTIPLIRVRMYSEFLLVMLATVGFWDSVIAGLSRAGAGTAGRVPDDRRGVGGG
jgi:hypothetical protein